jgi:hypothetical protein
MSFPDADSAEAWILDNQLGRRTFMGKHEWDYYVGRRQNLEKKHVGAPQGNSNAEKQLSQNETIVSANGPTRNKLAERFGVSPQTIERNSEYAEAVDAIGKVAGREAKQLILKGELALPRGPGRESKRRSPPFLGGDRAGGRLPGAQGVHRGGDGGRQCRPGHQGAGRASARGSVGGDGEAQGTTGKSVTRGYTFKRQGSERNHPDAVLPRPAARLPCLGRHHGPHHRHLTATRGTGPEAPGLRCAPSSPGSSGR